MEDLVHESERLSMEIDTDLEMPRIRRNLSQLLEAGNQLWNRTVGASANRDASEVRASVLLGARGYDYQKVSRNLDTLVSRGVKHYSTLVDQSIQRDIRESDIRGFVKNERENAIIHVIEEIKSASEQQVEKQYWHTVSNEWDKEKLEILNSISGADFEGSETFVSNPQMADKSVPYFVDPSSSIEIRSTYDIKSNMDYAEVVYAKCIMNYVDKVVNSSTSSDLVQQLIESIQRAVTDTNIGDLWDIVSYIITCCDPLRTSTDPVKLRESLMKTNKLQSLISDELDEAQLNAQENPISFFKTLFLSGQFEQAIEFLFRFRRYKSHAVHVAIALNEAGILVKPEIYFSLPILSKAATANATNCAIKSLNFTNILTRYTRKFAQQNTTEALYYYYLLRNCTTPTKENLFVVHVSELVRQTRDFDNLLGYTNDFGRIHGVIDKFNLDVDDIVSRIAEDCENSGQYEDAVKLYDSTSRHAKVLEILNKSLSEVLPGKRSDKSERDRIEELALKIANRYCEGEISTPRELSGTFYLLLDLMTFFNYYYSEQYVEGLDTIQKLKLLPMSPSEVEVKSREFNNYPVEIRRNISDILLATMSMLHYTYKEQPDVEIRKKAKALITFSGILQYKMPPDAITKLIELEVLIN